MAPAAAPIPSPRLRAARRPNLRISIVRCCARCGTCRAASRSPSSPSVRHRPPAPARASPAASYPSRLAVELSERLPGHDINVLNRGVNGEETDDMMARFATGVFAEHPQLVLWQVGTNSVLRDHSLEPHSALLREGIEELKADQCRRGSDRSAILRRHDRQARDARHGRADRARGQGRECRSVPALRGHARLVRGAASVLRRLRIAGPVAHERLELCLRGKTPRRSDRRSGDPSDRLGRGASGAQPATSP